MSESLATVIRPRPNGLRHIVVLYTVIFFIYLLARGDHTIDVPYTLLVFDWEDRDEFNIWYSKVIGTLNRFFANQCCNW